MTQNRDIATTFAKGLAVMRAFDGRAPALDAAGIARRTGFDRATVRRLVLTLEAEGYLQRRGRHFALTPRVLALAGGFLQAGGFGLRVQPVLERHAARLAQPLTLAVLEDDHVLLVAQSVTADAPVSFGFTLGSALPLLHTSLGRMLLANCPEDKAAHLIARAPLSPQTEFSLTCRDRIADAVAAARRSGHVSVDQEFETGIVGHAVPVGRNAVLGSSAPRGMEPPARTAARVLPHLQSCAAELAQSGLDVFLQPG